MIYFVTLVWILYSAYNFDVCGHSANKKITYMLIGVWLTLISAFQYRMGADIIAYMGEYQQYDKSISFDYITSFVVRRPGWVLLNQICLLITDDFVFLKTVIAVFVNFAVFHFFRKHSSFPFVCVFLYFIVLYFSLSFNVLRQSISLAIFLLGYDYLKSRSFIKYYIFCILAFLFHESAFILFLLPLATWLRINKESFKFFVPISVLFMIVFFILPSGVLSVLTNLSSVISNTILSERANSYLENDTTNFFSFFGLVKYIAFFILYCFVLYYEFKIKNTQLERNLVMVFISLYVLNVAFPILYRLNLYLQIIYILSAANFVRLNSIKIKNNSVQRSASSFMMAALLFIFVHFIPVVTSKVMYVQYFPYCSIFDKTIILERERMYGNKDNFIVY